MAVLAGEFARLCVSGSIVEREVGYVAVTLELFEHVVTANLSALVDRMKKFGFQPENL